MRSLLIPFTLSLLVSCTPSADVTSGSSSSGKAINQEAPFIWGDKTFPKTIHISSSFSAAEVTNMTEMATAWKTAVANQKTFFAIGAPGNNNYNINNTDGILGIYKATTWPADVSEEALAITQLFGRRYNVGDASEYVSIVEADILINYKPGLYAFAFDTVDEGSGYDLRTIVLHEMGHFLGLQHVPSYDYRPDNERNLTRSAYKETSVMYPSVSSIENKRIPQIKDISALVNKYSITSGSAPAMVASDALYRPQNNDPGKNVKIVIELRASGECLHKENGAVIRRHQLNFKK
jgi:hypothetical protein